MKYCNIDVAPVLMALMVCSGSSFAVDTNAGGSLPAPEVDQPATHDRGLTRAEVQAELEQSQARGLIGRDHINYPHSIPGELSQKMAEPERALRPLRMESDSRIYDHS